MPYAEANLSMEGAQTLLFNVVSRCLLTGFDPALVGTLVSSALMVWESNHVSLSLSLSFVVSFRTVYA